MPELLSRNRVRTWEKLPLAASLVGYCALASFTIPRHEPWADEAQAWQIARSNSLVDIFRTAIHYEATPGLWHALLWLLIRLHVGYAGLPWTSAAIALCGVGLLLFASPFPVALRVALPFTFFFAFQYSVVARNYSLVPPLLFGLAAIWRRRDDHPVLAALLIGLLANVSAHSFAVALGLIFVLLLEDRQRAYRNWRPRDRITAIVLVVLLVSFAIFCMVPAPDANWALAATRAAHNPVSSASTQIVTTHHRLQQVPLVLRVPLFALAGIVRVLGYGVSPFSIVAFAAWAILIWRWYSERRLRYIAPVVLLVSFCLLTRFEVYHAGLLWVLLVFLWWVTWPDINSDLRQQALIAFFAFFILSQLFWTGHVIRYDLSHAYSPDRAAAPLLQHYLSAGKQVDVAIPPPSFPQTPAYYSVGLEPYFASEPFHDQPARFWIWRPHPDMYRQYSSDIEHRSVVVLLDIPEGQRIQEQERLLALGYRLDANVCGQVVYPRIDNAALCHAFYVPR
jgi:hypothetical protein